PWIEFADLRIEQVVEVGRGLRRLLGGRGLRAIEPTPLLGLAPWHIRPADRLRVSDDARLDGPMLARAGHVIYFAFSDPAEPLGAETSRWCSRIERRMLCMRWVS